MSDEVELLEQQAEQRLLEAHQAEQDFIDRLQTEEQIALWNRCKDSLHAEKFWSSRTGQRVAAGLMKEILDAQREWLCIENPRDPKIEELHKRAQAAQLALFMMDKLIAEGAQAQQELNEIAAEMGE